jgi:hypothetical protein
MCHLLFDAARTYHRYYGSPVTMCCPPFPLLSHCRLRSPSLAPRQRTSHPTCCHHAQCFSCYLLLSHCRLRSQSLPLGQRRMLYSLSSAV